MPIRSATHTARHVLGGEAARGFLFKGLRRHAPIGFRSPGESYANASESFNRIRKPSER